jgi:DNA adenine methylase
MPTPSREAPSRTAPAQAPALRPFLKWAGGKSRVVPRIAAALSAVEGERLVEPFFGSGAVFLGLGRFQSALLADSNADLIELFRLVQRNPDALVRACRPLFREETNARPAYESLRTEFNALKAGSLRRAALFVYLNRHGYNGLCRYNRQGAFNVPFGRYVRPQLPEEALRRFHARLSSARVELVCADFRSVMQLTRPGDVVYADPPYLPVSKTSNFTDYASGPFGPDEQAALADEARTCAARGVTVLVSNHDTPDARRLYARAKLTTFSVTRTISSRTTRRHPAGELLALFRARG